MNKLQTLAIVTLIGAAVSACAGAQTKFYTLDAAVTDVATNAYAGPALRIDAVHIPPALDRPELVRETVRNRFTVSDNDHWAAPLGELLRRVLTEDLAGRLPNGKVIFPDAPKPPGSGGIVVDILNIIPSTGVVTMDVSWTLLSPSAAPDQASRPRARQYSARLTTRAGSGVSSNASEISRLSDQLAGQIAASLMSESPSD